MSRARRKQADLAIALYHKGIHQRKPGRGGTGVDSIAKLGLDRGGASVWPLLYQRVSLGETAATMLFPSESQGSNLARASCIGLERGSTVSVCGWVSWVLRRWRVSTSSTPLKLLRV